LRVLVCGGRDYIDRAELYAELDRLHAEYCFDTVVASGARGADELSVEWAQGRGIATQVVKAEWGTFGRRATLTRNTRMLAEGRPDLVIAFPGRYGRYVEAGEGGRDLGSDPRLNLAMRCR